MYVSHRIHNELIDTCTDVLKEDILQQVIKASFFSVLADETADISGVEQLSIGVRYVRFEEGNDSLLICEEFLGYAPPLEEVDAATISDTILQFLNSCGLDLKKLVGQGYDGCSTVAGHVGGVQALIREKYPLPTFFHCTKSGYKLPK